MHCMDLCQFEVLSCLVNWQICDGIVAHKTANRRPKTRHITPTPHYFFEYMTRSTVGGKGVALFYTTNVIRRTFLSRVYTVSRKKRDIKLLSITSPNVNGFSQFLLSDSVVNLQQNHVWIFHQAFSMSLQYPVKHESQKTNTQIFH